LIVAAKVKVEKAGKATINALIKPKKDATRAAAAVDAATDAAATCDSSNFQPQVQHLPQSPREFPLIMLSKRSDALISAFVLTLYYVGVADGNEASDFVTMGDLRRSRRIQTHFSRPGGMIMEGIGFQYSMRYQPGFHLHKLAQQQADDGGMGGMENPPETEAPMPMPTPGTPPPEPAPTEPEEPEPTIPMLMMIIASGGDGGDAEMQMLAHKKLLNVFECSSISQLNRFQFRCIPCLQFARHHRPQFA